MAYKNSFAMFSKMLVKFFDTIFAVKFLVPFSGNIKDFISLFIHGFTEILLIFFVKKAIPTEIICQAIF